MHHGVRQKLSMCTRLARNGIRNRVCLWLYLSIQRAVHFPLFFPASVMTPVHSKRLLDMFIYTFTALIWAEKITSSNLSDRTNSGGAVMSQLPYWGASSNTTLHGSYMNVTPFNHRHSTSIINYARYSALNTFH